MIFAHIFLPAILFAICKAQPQSFTPNNDRPSMDEYRHLVLNSVAQMKDSCRVYDYLLDVDKKWTDDDGKLEVAPYGATETIRSNRDFYIHTLLRILRENANDDDQNEEPSVIFSVMLTKFLLTDSKLDSQLTSMLQAKCCRDSDDDALNCLEKREPRTIKKVKFHSWGGKRDGNNGIDNVPKIVLRTPFRPWGGKRDHPDGGRRSDEWTNVSQ
ncbi:uncharacterized protein LOC119076908 [Bradysia coprophila]|uniref:uncharacterized protein LOC119076908 n=1 Tax=Bradysia coprophila TaxID=38358 RepID=UPI00187DAD97|nr:uncharacterized protein LOC119076908 [Bradysia coprophila]XP_037039821.1 uncharacterized protein LOC119076908 [Bradysia coprophila]